MLRHMTHVLCYVISIFLGFDHTKMNFELSTKAILNSWLALSSDFK